MSKTTPDVVEHREWLCSLVDVTAVGSLLDVGCGSGEDVMAIAKRVPLQDARLIGLDSSAKAVEQARRAAADDSRLVFQAHRIGSAIPFENGSFDVVYSNNLLECIGDKTEFLRDVARVLRTGGQVVFAHWDWDSQTLDAGDKDLVRRIVHAFADWQQGWMEHSDGWMGRRLWSAFQATSQFEGGIRARVLTNTTYSEPWYGHARIADFGSMAKRGLISSDDYERLIEQVEELAAADRYFYSVTCYAYVGRKL